MTGILTTIANILFGSPREDLQLALQALQNKSGIAARLLDEAKRDHVRIGLAEDFLDPSKPGIQINSSISTYRRFRNAPSWIIIKNDADQDLMAIETSHELFHHHQWQAMTFDPDRLDKTDVETWFCAMEAGADCATLAIATETARQGDPGLLDLLMTCDSSRKNLAHHFHHHLDPFSKDPAWLIQPMQEAFFAWMASPLRNSYAEDIRADRAEEDDRSPDKAALRGTRLLTVADLMQITTLPGMTKSFLAPEDPRLAALLRKASGRPFIPLPSAPGC